MADKFKSITDEELMAEAQRRRQAAEEARRAEALAAYGPLLDRIKDVATLADAMRPLHTAALSEMNDGLWGRLRTWLQVTDQLVSRADQIAVSAPLADTTPTEVPAAS